MAPHLVKAKLDLDVGIGLDEVMIDEGFSVLEDGAWRGDRDVVSGGTDMSAFGVGGSKLSDVGVGDERHRADVGEGTRLSRAGVVRRCRRCVHVAVNREGACR